jgi:uncharacterized membrane protein YheB (UPF0754 family)
MFKEKITYTNYNGEKVTEDFYFNLTKAELADMQLSKEGTMSEYLTMIRDTNDVPKIAEMFKKIILKAYGEKSVDGKYFYKVRDGHELAEDFSQTEAFSELYMKLATNENAASTFIQKLIPQEYATQIEKQGGAEFARNVAK